MSVKSERQQQALAHDNRQSGKYKNDDISQLVSAAMSDIQKEIDLQSLIDSSMKEFAVIHQQQQKQQERLKQAMLQKQRE